MRPFRGSVESPELKKLKREWYKKLAQTGFKDIELPGDCAMLTHYDSTRFYRVDANVFGSQQAYFEQAGRFLYDNHFLDQRHKAMWRWHAEGLEIIEISKKLRIGVPTVSKALKKLRAKMLNQLENVITFRDGTPADHTFVYATLLRGIYYGCPQMNLIPKDAFMENYHKVVEGILATPTTVLKIACLPEDHDCIVGYALGDARGIVHFIFVKTAWRKLGIAKALLKSLGRVRWATVLTRIGERLIKQIHGLRYNPFAMLGGIPDVQESEE